jgi:hypothetical protein
MSTIDAAMVTWTQTRAQPRRLFSAEGSPAVSRQLGYMTAFGTAMGDAAWHSPWLDDDSYNYYWARNLGPNYRAATADRAWKRQVPLREAAPLTLTTSLPGVTLKSDGFLFPCGTGVTVQAEIGGPLNAAGLLGLVEKLASDKVIITAGSTQPRALAAVLSTLLEGIEQQVLGAIDSAATGGITPTAIAAVTASSGWPAAPIGQGDPVHRLLEGLCLTSAAPLTGTVSDLGTAMVAGAHRRPGTIRYSVGGNCAIWLPEFTTQHDSKRIICYHRNLTIATMQTSVLLDAVRLAAQPGGTFGEDVKATMRPVVNVLGLLYGKVSDMYASAVVRNQINDSGLVAEIGQLRVRLGVGSPLR